MSIKLLLRISYIILAFAFMLAGFNHFRNPEPYLSLIPPYIPLPNFINFLVGFFEISLGAGLLIKSTRKKSAWGIIILLILFIPAHIFMIQKAPFMMGATLITPTIAWLRLPLQFVLILWAYVHTKNTD